MGSSYYITYGGNRLTFPGATGSVAWEYVPPPKFSRYEISIFGGPSAGGSASGTASMPFTAFDQIGVKATYSGELAAHGNGYWWWYDVSSISGRNMMSVPFMLCNNANFHKAQSLFSLNMTAGSFAFSGNSANPRWDIYTPLTANTKLQSTTLQRARLIGEIVGVKYR